MFCKNCGATIAASDEKCARCGFQAPALSECGGFYDLAPKAPKAEPAPAAVSAKPQPAPAPSRTSPLLIAAVAGLMLVILVLQVVILTKLADHENRINNLFGIVEKAPEDPEDSENTQPQSTEPNVTDPDLTEPSGTVDPSEPPAETVTDPTKVPEELPQATTGTTAEPETETTMPPTEQLLPTEMTEPSVETTDPVQTTEPTEEVFAPVEEAWELTVEDVLISEKNQEKDESEVAIISDNCPAQLRWSSWSLHGSGTKSCTYVSQNEGEYITVQYKFDGGQESAAVTVLTAGELFAVQEDNASIAFKCKSVIAGFISSESSVAGNLEYSNEEELDFSLDSLDMEKLSKGEDFRLEISWSNAQGRITVVLCGEFEDFFPNYEI